MLLWLCGHIPMLVSIFLCLVVTFRSRFHSDYLAPPSVLALSKRSTMLQMFLLTDTLTTSSLLQPVGASLLSWAVFNFAQQLVGIPFRVTCHATEQGVRSWQSSSDPWTASIMKLWCLIFNISENGDSHCIVREVGEGK